MREPLQGAITVVTGASSGLGRRIATELHAQGAIVTGVARRGADIDGVESKPCDVSDSGTWRSLLAEIEATHGRIDVLVNAAGMERRRGAEQVTEADVAETMAVNFTGTVTGTLAVLPGMLRRGRGIICNVSSDHGRAPGPGTPAYCASKASVSAFTESLAHEVAGRGVHLHVLYPGWVPTALGQGAVDQGMALPPRAVRRTEQQVADLVVRRLGRPQIDINAARVAALAPVVRALAPRLYARSLRAATRDRPPPGGRRAARIRGIR